MAKIDSTIKQWKEVKKVVKKTSKTLKWGLLGLEAVDQKINGHIDGLSFFKEDIGAIPEGSTTTSLVDEIARITRSRIYEQEKIEWMKKSLLPSAELNTVLENLLRACGVVEEKS